MASNKSSPDPPVPPPAPPPPPPPNRELEPENFDIIKATQYGLLERVRSLLDEGFDVNRRDTENITLLHWASINARKEIVKLIIDRGGVVDAVGGELSSTPLHWATRQGHLAMVVLLMRHGADPSLRDGEGCSCIHLAAQFGYTSIVAFLLAKGISPDIQDKNGLSPLMWAVARVHSYDPARLLLTFGANPTLQDRVRGNTAYHWAIGSKNGTAVQLLGKRGVSLHTPNDDGDTPLSLLQSLKTPEWIDKKTVAKIIEKSEGGGSGGGCLNSYRRDKNFRFWGTAAIPFVVMYLIGVTFSSDLHLLIKGALLLLGFAVFRGFGQLVCDDRFMNIFPLSVYLSTKMWMYLVWFIYMAPILPYSTTIVLVGSSTLLWYNFLRAWLGDPGKIQISIYERHQTIIDLAEEDGFDPKNFCTTCLIRKPIRSKHCSICDVCVARLDHHCPWLSNCVGWKNHKNFIGYLFFVVLLCLIYIYGATEYWGLDCGVDSESPWALLQFSTCNPWVTFMAVQAAIHATWVSLLLLCQLYQILFLGMTTNERLNYSRYSYFKRTGSRRSEWVNRGLWKNLVDFFELNWFRGRGEKIDWSRAYPRQGDGEEQGEGGHLLNSRDNFQYV